MNIWKILLLVFFAWHYLSAFRRAVNQPGLHNERVAVLLALQILFAGLVTATVLA